MEQPPLLDSVPSESTELQLDGFIDERSAVCIANFVGGFAIGMVFCRARLLPRRPSHKTFQANGWP